MTAVAVMAATAQAGVSWMGRNSHVELGLHLERVKSCAGVAAKSGPFLSNVNSLADMSVAIDSQNDRERVLAARDYVRRVQADLNEHLSVLELIGDKEMTEDATSLTLDIQTVVNLATGLKDLGDQEYRDKRAGLTETFRSFVQLCRQKLGVERGT